MFIVLNINKLYANDLILIKLQSIQMLMIILRFEKYGGQLKFCTVMVQHIEGAANK